MVYLKRKFARKIAQINLNATNIKLSNFVFICICKNSINCNLIS